MVKKNLGDLSETDLTNITQQAITLDEVYGIDMNETLRGVNSLMQQYGLTAQEAMDYIVTGTQNGLDKTNELGDNLSEYAGKFSQAGYSASEYFQLLDNGLKNGAYNLDKVNDAINEVTTRLADGTIGDSIGSFSSKTQELFKSWQNGGATQKEVIDSIVADIANCENQQEALNLAALAFGTMAEDGNLKFITSLTSVGSTYDSVTGSAQGMFDATTTPMQQLEANTRKLKQSLIPLGEKIAELANTLIPPLTAVLSKIGEWFGKLPEPIQNFTIILGALMAIFIALVPVIAALAVSIGALEVTLWPIIAVIAAVAAAIAIVIAIVKNWGAITEWFSNLWTTICNGIGVAIDGLKTWFMGSVAIAVVVALIISYFLSRRLIRPLKKIGVAAKEISLGRYTTIDTNTKIDEYNEMISSFNTMSRELEQQDKARSEFIANVSHDLRTPLTTIMGFVRGIMDGTIPPEMQNQYLGVTLSEAERMRDMVNNNLDLSKYESGNIKLSMSTFNLNEIVRSIVVSMEKRIREKGIMIQFKYERTENFVEADESAIYRVVQNLLDNALKFAAKETEIEISITRKNELVLCRIKNYGSTISPEEQLHIWDRYYKADESRGFDKRGSGLGLFIVKSIINQHNQQIYIDSDDDSVAFEFTLNEGEC